MRPRLIGLVGFAGSGKTTVASIMEADFGFHRMRFADTLKNMLLALGLTREQVDGHKKETPCPLLGGSTPRWAMQTLGTEWGRNLIDSNLWVNAGLAAYRKRVIGNYVFDDVRFLNEAEAIKKEGGEIWRVEQPGANRVRDVHASEVEQIHIVPDWIVRNEGSLDDLRKTIHNSLEEDWNANS